MRNKHLSKAFVSLVILALVMEAFSAPALAGGSCASSVRCSSNNKGGYISVNANKWQSSVYSHYEVSRYSRSSNNWTVVYTGRQSGQNCSYQDNSCSLNTSYTYRVRGYYVEDGSKCYSGYVNSPSVSCDVANPGSCSSLSARRKSSNSVQLEWEPSDDCDGYEVVYCKSGSSDYELVGSCSSRYSSRSVNGLTCDNKYQFKVRAYREAGNKRVYSGYTKAASCEL